ncbi:hypothetical protein [Ktedonosporobacter rubrisoli]|nr:hypothetical protein [Ktedonosporobacter rubrisoli]
MAPTPALLTALQSATNTGIERLTIIRPAREKEMTQAEGARTS